jgi:phosphatidylethanolamine-binding protein (PEBP) family uncharacterized protein
VEPRRGALSRLAPRAKVASAGVILALAAAALLGVSGCGGDSEGSGAQSTTEAASATKPAKEANPSTDTAVSKQGKGSASKPSGRGSQAQAKGTGQNNTSVPQPERGRERAPTPAEEAEATVADISLTSPALRADASGAATLPPQYTCDGKDSWPPMRWQGVPPDTEELVLFAMSAKPIEGRLFFDWALAGIDPDLEEIEAGRLPKGAISGRNGFGKNGYSICPALGEAETYVFALFALPERLSPEKGFDPAELRRAVLEVSGSVGLLAAGYRR